MGDFSPDEISVYLAVSGYRIEFDDGKPVWLLEAANPDRSLTEQPPGSV